MCLVARCAARCSSIAFSRRHNNSWLTFSFKCQTTCCKCQTTFSRLLACHAVCKAAATSAAAWARSKAGPVSPCSGIGVGDQYCRLCRHQTQSVLPVEMGRLVAEGGPATEGWLLQAIWVCRKGRRWGRVRTRSGQVHWEGAAVALSAAPLAVRLIQSGAG